MKTRLVAVLKPAPLIVITLPGWPKEGEKLLIVALWHGSGKSNAKSIAAIIGRNAQLLLVFPVETSHLYISVLHEVANNRHLLFASYSMPFHEFAPVNSQAGPPQNVHLRTNLRDWYQRILRAVR